ncbi:MAG: bacteriohemerythrin [Spirochaetes bacterium]|nr:MAG: bacteriohemerythrin [Spirochaetota bacterium]
MIVIVWNDKFAINVEQVDEQHRTLFELTRALYDIVKTESAEKQTIEGALDALVDYTAYHFKSEEALMREIDYPRYESHKLEHDTLTAQALDFRTQLLDGKPVDTEEFLNFLFNWLTKHIMDKDKKIGAYIELQDLKVRETEG